MNGMIKTYARLNAAIIKNDLTIPARAWFLLRALDEKDTNKESKGWVSIDAFKKAWNHFSLSRAHWRAVVNHPKTYQFFTVVEKENKIWYKSHKKIAEMLDLNELGTVTEFPASSISNIKTFRAHLYASFFKSNSHYSRDTLSEIFGITRQTQYDYERITGLVVEESVACAELTEEAINDPEKAIDFVSNLPINAKEDNHSPYWFNTTGKVIYWQTVNCFRPSEPAYQHNVSMYGGKCHRKTAQCHSNFHIDTIGKRNMFIDKPSLIYTGKSIVGQSNRNMRLYRYSSITPLPDSKAMRQSNVVRQYQEVNGRVLGSGYVLKLG